MILRCNDWKFWDPETVTSLPGARIPLMALLGASELQAEGIMG
jgi:hypothetical protein